MPSSQKNNKNYKTKSSSKRTKKTSPSVGFNLKNYIRVGIVLALAGVLVIAFAIYNSAAPKTEKASTASQVITNLYNSAKTADLEAPVLQKGASIHRFESDQSNLKSSKNKTMIWLTTVPTTSYDSIKSSIDKYFTERSYTKHDNGKSGAGLSTNYDGDKFSCQVDDWGASFNGITKIQEKTLLVACASADDFETEAQKTN